MADNILNDLTKVLAWQATRPYGTSSLGPNYDPSEVRLDELGNAIRWGDYGKFNSLYGWEIDHRTPSALGGSDHFSNLRALHCSANRSLGGALNALLNTKY